MRTPAADRGATTVADRAVRRIAERAATEALGPGEVRVSRGSAAVRGRRARVGVTVAVPYPGVLDDAGESVRSHVTDRTAELTGLSVDSARVHVRELSLRKGSREGSTEGADYAEGTEYAEGAKATSTEATSPEETVTQGARRPWSERRLPVAVLALAAAVASGVLLYDVVAVHAADRSPARWRVRLVDWLATHGPDGGTTVNLAAAAAVFALGVCLLVLAITPGQRRRLPMTPPLPGVRAVLERGTAAALLRDAVAEVPGVTRVRVRVGRRRARARVWLGFGDPVTARQEALRAAQAALAECGLTRPPRLVVRLRTEPSWHEPAPPPAEPGPGADATAPRLDETPATKPASAPAAPGPDTRGQHTPDPSTPDTTPQTETQEPPPRSSPS
ncbi:DUF6286 domain-containing Asp23/Gls24 family envelope stress response protein [Streptomyces flavofungini]|uniref:DUF6286 domain-containing protein n=1 Tax=Streptomyces flavofungini TaxID=68200 RepID=A0ABS0XA60_9ACTN|nr:DUF6286 domain-containing protein [Streptomyces flavofungini]MBJ3810085.1 hypothetical protein [Streptomyces flavofungini]GHC81483.1 hypothetical protein GCM10010349_64610 [Streptomyces flavofungini]